MSVYARFRELMFECADILANPELAERLDKIPTRVNEYGYDPWGYHRRSSAFLMSVGHWLYRNYFRCKVYGIEQVPEGRVLLIANHSGQLPFDAVMLQCAMLVDAPQPRLVRGMAERWFPTLPFFSSLLPRLGHVVGDPVNCVNLLENEEAVMVFPEGVRGSGKTWWHRYELQRFGTGFMRLALETETPIVPVGIVGGEEQMVSFWDGKPLARLLGMPYIPFGPTFPLLGPAGALPLPTRYHIHFDEPLTFEGDEDTHDNEVRRMVDVVKAKIHRLIQYGIDQREGVFR